MPIFLTISSDVGSVGLKDERHCQAGADRCRPRTGVMDDRTQSKDGGHEKGPDKGLTEKPIGQDPSQAGANGQNRGDESSESEIAGYPFAAPKSMEQRPLVPDHEEET